MIIRKHLLYGVFAVAAAVLLSSCMQMAIRSENWKSLDIYGKVVDQDGTAVSGAKVEGSILLNGNFVESRGETHFTQTDSQGRFEFLGIHGVKIGIVPTKDGYYFKNGLSPQRPEGYHPDRETPLVFTMWKIHGPELLVNSSLNVKLHSDGSPVTFDISTGKESADGDLSVTFFRFPSEVLRRSKFDWGVKIEMLNGGLVPENVPYPYWAPEGNYQPAFEYSVSSNNIAAWRPSLDKNFYIRNSRGQYGRMQLHLFSSLTPASLQINFTINPSGSQNLEPDFSKQ